MVSLSNHEGISADFIKEGERLAEVLSSAESAQEKERKALPKEAEEYAFKKGSLSHPERATRVEGTAP